MFSHRLIVVVFSVFLVSACTGGSDTDQGKQDSSVSQIDTGFSKDTPDNVKTDKGVEKEKWEKIKEIYNKECKKCKKKDGSCRSFNEVKKNMTSYEIEETLQGNEMFVAATLCECNLEAVNGEEDSCKKPCETERKVEGYTWKCPDRVGSSLRDGVLVEFEVHVEKDGKGSLDRDFPLCHMKTKEKGVIDTWENEGHPEVGPSWSYDGGKKLYIWLRKDSKLRKEECERRSCINTDKCGG